MHSPQQTSWFFTLWNPLQNDDLQICKIINLYYSHLYEFVTLAIGDQCNNPCSWIKRLNTVNMTTLPKLIYKFNTIFTKIPAAFFEKIDKLTLKFIWKFKGFKIAYIILEKKNKMEGLIFPHFRTHYKLVK